MSAFDLVVAGVAAALAGAVNALAGGGTLISFPALVALGVPAVEANVTNTVSLCPGYLSGAWSLRHELRPQLGEARSLALVAGLGGLIGSALLIVIPEDAFDAAVPWLVLLSCGLLAAQGRVRALASRRSLVGVEPESPPPPRDADGAPGSEQGRRSGDADLAPSLRPTAPLLLATGAAAVYGGFFGAGLGIMLLAVLGLFSSASITRLNSVKLALSFVINVVAAAFLAFSDRVEWALVPPMALGAVLGGLLGARLNRHIRPGVLRVLIIVFGVAVAVRFWL